MDDKMDEELMKDEEELTANKELVINSIPTHSKKKHSEHGLTSSVQIQTELQIQTEVIIQIQIQIPTHSKKKNSKLGLTTSVHGEHCRGSSQPEAEQGVHLGTQIFLWVNDS